MEYCQLDEGINDPASLLAAAAMELERRREDIHAETQNINE